MSCKFAYLLPLCLIINLFCIDPNAVNSASDPQTKGMSIFFYGKRNTFTIQDFSAKLDDLKSTGCNTVALIPYAFQDNQQSSVVNFIPDSSISYDDFNTACSISISKGFSLIIKPHVNCIDYSPRTKITPSDINTWISTYTSFILTFANCAQINNASVFCVGTELMSLSGNSQLWVKLIDTVRQVYKGNLTYASCPQEALNIRFWASLDIIGINAYMPISYQKNPTVEACLESWGYWSEMAHDLATQFDKRVMLTEIGYMNSSNAASQPGSFTDKGVRDDHLQATLYKAAIIASQHIRSLDGIIFWQWELEKLDTTKIDYSPQGREAEQVLREFWL